MTAETVTVLRCNHAGTEGPCTETFGPVPYSAERARHLARDYGWGGPALRDLCAAHSGRRGYRTTYEATA